jgi:hypothetical protein
MEHLGRDRQRNRGLLIGMVRGMSDPREGSKILSFLFRSPLVCSLLLHLRSSCKVNCANFAARVQYAHLTARIGHSCGAPSSSCPPLTSATQESNVLLAIHL